MFSLKGIGWSEILKYSIKNTENKARNYPRKFQKIDPKWVIIMYLSLKFVFQHRKFCSLQVKYTAKRTWKIFETNLLRPNESLKVFWTAGFCLIDVNYAWKPFSCTICGDVITRNSRLFGFLSRNHIASFLCCGYRGNSSTFNLSMKKDEGKNGNLYVLYNWLPIS